MQQLGMGQAINQALREAMERDPDVFLAGEGIGVGIHHSPMLPTVGLLDAFGQFCADVLFDHGDARLLKTR